MTDPTGMPDDIRRPGVVQGWRTRKPVHRRVRSGGWQGLIFVVVMLFVMLAGGWIAFGATLRAAAVDLFEGNTGAIRMPFVSELLAAELAERITRPAGTDETPIRFLIEEGQTLAEIEDALVAAGLLTDRLAFQYLVVSGGLEARIIAGAYTMDSTYSPRDVVGRLAGSPDPITPRVTLALRQGLRIEQVVALLQTLGLDTDLREFHRLLTEPDRDLVEEYDYLSVVPRGNSLEGFVGSGVFEIPIDISPLDLARLLLDDWREDIGNHVIPAARRQKMDLYEVLILASLVERETGVDDERARIAGVYTNRLDPNLHPTLIMNADPSVIYGVDSVALQERPFGRWQEYVFWMPVGQSLSQVSLPERLSSFQTYTQAGLPDWPIASPSRKSIEAVLEPNTKRGSLYFYSCPGSREHVFARNLEQHERNIAACR